MEYSIFGVNVQVKKRSKIIILITKEDNLNFHFVFPYDICFLDRISLCLLRRAYDITAEIWFKNKP